MHERIWLYALLTVLKHRSSLSSSHIVHTMYMCIIMISKAVIKPSNWEQVTVQNSFGHAINNFILTSMVCNCYIVFWWFFWFKNVLQFVISKLNERATIVARVFFSACMHARMFFMSEKPVSTATHSCRDTKMTEWLRWKHKKKITEVQHCLSLKMCHHF